MGGTAVWQRRDTVYGGNLSTEFKLPKKGGKGGKSDTLCSMNAQLNNKGNGQVRGNGEAAGVSIAAREVSWRRGLVAGAAGAADCAGYQESSRQLRCTLSCCCAGAHHISPPSPPPAHTATAGAAPEQP